MSKFTPGPWEWDWKLAPDSLEADCGIRYFDGNTAYSVARCPRYQREETWKADASLIVAAREMLEELQNIANADYRKWDDGLNTPENFVLWAQSRAKHILAKMALE